MINVLEFSTSHEYKYAWNTSAKTCIKLFQQLKNCLLIYKYKLPTPFDVPEFSSKFGTGNCDKIDYEKIVGKNLMLFHLDVYKGDPQKIRHLIDWSVLNNIELFIPIRRLQISHHRDSYLNQLIISEIISEYDTKKYDMTDLNHNVGDELISKKIRYIIRDSKLKDILG